MTEQRQQSDDFHDSGAGHAGQGRFHQRTRDAAQQKQGGTRDG
ncbi:hypothetical protein [Luteibacter anthropi]|nr:hypothetical protein [Luteibacter anthropi]